MRPDRAAACWRCGAVGYVAQIDITSMADSAPRYIDGASSGCPTPGCVDASGSARLDPPSPLELITLANRLWLARQASLIEDMSWVTTERIR